MPVAKLAMPTYFFRLKPEKNTSAYLVHGTLMPPKSKVSNCFEKQ